MRKELEGQMTVAQAIEETERAVERAAKGMDSEWAAMAHDAVREVCRTHLHFTTDEVWGVLDAARCPAPREPRAMGAIMRQAVREGLCVVTDEYRPSKRRHRAPIRVYRPVR